MQQRCHHTSASALSLSWQSMPSPRLQLAATARREKVQLHIREQLVDDTVVVDTGVVDEVVVTGVVD